MAFDSRGRSHEVEVLRPMRPSLASHDQRDYLLAEQLCGITRALVLSEYRGERGNHIAQFRSVMSNIPNGQLHVILRSAKTEQSLSYCSPDNPAQGIRAESTTFSELFFSMNSRDTISIFNQNGLIKEDFEQAQLDLAKTLNSMLRGKRFSLVQHADILDTKYKVLDDTSNASSYLTLEEISKKLGLNMFAEKLASYRSDLDLMQLRYR